MMDKKWLEFQIMQFMTVIVHCLDSTTYTNDRGVYQQDISVVARWLSELHKGVSADEVASRIVGRQTDKYFADYWKQGELGEKELLALEKLRHEIRVRKELASEADDRS